MTLLRYLRTQDIFDTTQNNSVINLDPSGIGTHTPIVRAQQGKYDLSSCVASHGVFFSSWFGVCPAASHPYFCYSFAAHPNSGTIYGCCFLFILHATVTCASRFIHCHSQRLEDPPRLARDERSSYHVQTKCHKVSQTWICLTLRRLMSYIYGAAHLLRSWVRIPPGAWIFVCCECRVLSGGGLCDELITRPEES